mgnify:CR=1 FL=1
MFFMNFSEDCRARISAVPSYYDNLCGTVNDVPYGCSININLRSKRTTLHHCRWQWSPSLFANANRDEKLRKASVFYSPAKLYNRRSPLICHLPFPICHFAKPPASGIWHPASLQSARLHFAFGISHFAFRASHLQQPHTCCFYKNFVV